MVIPVKIALTNNKNIIGRLTNMLKNAYFLQKVNKNVINTEQSAIHRAY